MATGQADDHLGDCRRETH